MECLAALQLTGVVLEEKGSNQFQFFMGVLLLHEVFVLFVIIPNRMLTENFNIINQIKVKMLPIGPKIIPLINLFEPFGVNVPTCFSFKTF